jgi:hypothetical protein
MKYRKGPGQDTAYKDTLSVIHFLHLGSTPSFSLPSYNAIIVRIHRAIHPFIMSEPSDLILSGKVTTDSSQGVLN